jgi:hypothetical protein
MAAPKIGKFTVPAIRFKQWLADWNEYDFDPQQFRREPEPYLYLFSMRAAELRRLSDVYRRKRQGNVAEGIQRKRDDSRTARIQRYVHYGYPYGDLPKHLRTEEFAELRKPGWLPTAIVVNILQPGDERHGLTIDAKHVVTIRRAGGAACELQIPPLDLIEQSPLAPLEVIDGQHRLWAFEDANGGLPVPDDFELPVVAYRGLDIAWQAYLFWSINVSPKRINPSHAFDLYPLLRTQDWLEQAGEIKVYQSQSPMVGTISALVRRSGLMHFEKHCRREQGEN